MKLSIRNDSNKLSIFAKNPENYEEGELKLHSLDVFFLGFARFKRIIGSIEMFL